MESGIAAPFSAAILDNTPFWLHADARGQGIVVRGDGLSYAIVSTRAIETYINTLPRVDDAIGWTYQEEGHSFYVLYFPAAELLREDGFSLVYDVSTQSWAYWSLWDPVRMRHTPHLGRCHAFAFGKHLVGSRLDGAIHWQQLDRYEDALVA
jgi:hypothetical protein